MNRLEGHRALVTGTTAQLAHDCALALRREGAEVVLAGPVHGISPGDIAPAKEDDLSIEVVELDPLDIDAVARTVSMFGPFDILCTLDDPLRKTGSSPTPATQIAGSNVRTAYFLASEAARAMEGGGSIIHVASNPTHADLSNGNDDAVTRMTRSMAAAWDSRNIRVNTVRRASQPLQQSSTCPAGITSVGEAVVYLASGAPAISSGDTLIIG